MKKTSKVHKRKLYISVCTEEEFMQDALQALKNAEAGIFPKEPVHKLHFITEADLFRALSPKRMELLRFLLKHGPLSCRKLTALLKRSYANVHADVQGLIKLDLIKKNKEQRLTVPWDELDIAVRLVA